MKQIKKSMLSIIGVEDDDRILKTFAMDEFERKFSHNPSNNVWYKDYKVLDKDTIRIYYEYGGGDQIMDGQFDVKVDDY
jgi:hypothetical protein